MSAEEVSGDFDAIDFKDCIEVKWSKDMTTLPAVSEMRLIAFWPVPPSVRAERLALSAFPAELCWRAAHLPQLQGGLPDYVRTLRI